jgi:hypothetical protein
MLRAVIALVQHFMTEFNGTVLDEAKIVAVTKIVLTVMEQKVSADDVNLLGDNIDTIKKHTETLMDASKEFGLEANA